MHSGVYRRSLSPTSSGSDVESDSSQHSGPNDLTTSNRSKQGIVGVVGGGGGNNNNIGSNSGGGNGSGNGGGSNNGSNNNLGSSTFPTYSSFYSPTHQSAGSLGQGSHGSSGSHHGSACSPFIATNECRIIEYRGARLAAFLSANRTPCEYLLCLPQAFELFLKHLVGGLHTVYTKLKVRIVDIFF